MNITRFDAARRQLQTALQLWFADGEPVSTHALACAAYQIIHDLNHSAKGRPLLFDNPVLKKSLVKDAVASLKAQGNFLKHADLRRSKPSDSIEFNPSLTELFLLASVLGVQYLHSALVDLESAFIFWCMLYRVDWLDKQATDEHFKSINANTINGLRGLEKHELLNVFIDSRQARRDAGIA